jgi:hypothetical protein
MSDGDLQAQEAAALGVRVCRDRAHLVELATLGPWGAATSRAPASRGRGPLRRTRGEQRGLDHLGPGPAAGHGPAAWELGIGSVPLPSTSTTARELLGFPADWHCEFILSFGYPADPGVLTAPNRAGGRKALTEIVHEERW